ncbi:unnamed protein product [Ambrosiozyma monospora]|uniref:Unnamed protein product n=1 Tax=Ambrosiozyma monospora TaxID=43982 RepID=A0ACB5U6K3_AMBMO|nr:unnamed protein product [Ambrosiozyma monospora]
MVGSLLFEKIFGDVIGRRLLTFSVAISAGGNIITVLYHVSRVDQEIFREGFLPFSKFFASNYPFGTPLRALFFPLAISVFFLVLKTPSDVYDYIINLEGYPQNLFVGLSCFGIFILRRRNEIDVDSGIRASYFHVIFMTLFCLFLTIAPLNPFSENEKKVSLSMLILLFSSYFFVCFIGLSSSACFQD